MNNITVLSLVSLLLVASASGLVVKDFFQFAYAEITREDQQEQDHDPFRYDLKTWQRYAHEGDAEAQFILGLRYVSGAGVQQDFGKAYIWYQLAAEQGHANAQYNLAHLYLSGDGVARDVSKALYWWQQAARKGHVRAQYNLGYAYYRGIGTKPDHRLAVSWLTLAAEKNDRRAKKLLKALESQIPATGPIAESQEKLQYLDEVVDDEALDKDKVDTHGEASGQNESRGEVAAPESALLRESNPWLFEQPRDFYTVQLISSNSRDSVESFVEKRQLRGMVRMFHTRRDARDWWYVLFGSYSSREAAIEALARIQMNPDTVWIRRIGKLQEKRCRAWMENQSSEFAGFCSDWFTRTGQPAIKN